MWKLWKGPGRLAAAAMFAGLFGSTLLASISPGTLNYFEGRASIDGQHLTSKAPGSTSLSPNQVLSTENGKAEVLLIPGTYLRLGDDTSIRMVSPSITDTRFEVQHGEAMLEVDEFHKQNNITVMQNGGTAQIQQKGLYRFNADHDSVAVYDGKAEVWSDDHHVTLKKGKEAFLNQQPLKAEKFDRDSHDPLYAWSSLRSKYEAEASTQYASSIVVANSPWWGPGWYWNPYWGTYGFVPGAGVLYSPFGWGFYSPLVIERSPVILHRYVPVRPVNPGFGVNPGFRGPGLHRGLPGGGTRAPMGGFHGGMRRR